ncbi:unnamed protein product [Mytilus coruscus]|uniref:Uncharacterized protein n=1 Tax=Mytilus coruscus TaxID=42192 RepID=A0A6J8DCF3_MYTCO|nr:unnamed protein product [Mytilus coruscus]
MQSNEWQAHEIEQSTLRIHIPGQSQEKQNHNKNNFLIECSYIYTSILIIFCIVSLFMFLGILGYSVFTLFEIYEFSLKIKQIPDNDSWRYMYLDETSLCFTLRREDVHHSGCAKYLFHDISDRQSFTCCVRDSSQYALLYKMIFREQTRRSSGVENTACNHGIEKVETPESGMLHQVKN